MRDLNTDLNNAAFRRLEEAIKSSFPADHFVAFVDGGIIADAASFEELDFKLDAAPTRWTTTVTGPMPTQNYSLLIAFKTCCEEKAG